MMGGKLPKGLSIVLKSIGWCRNVLMRTTWEMATSLGYLIQVVCDHNEMKMLVVGRRLASGGSDFNMGMMSRVCTKMIRRGEI